MPDVKHDDRPPVFVDLIQDAPFPPQPSAVDAAHLTAKGFADPSRIIEKRSGDELGGGERNVVRESAGQRPPSLRRGTKLEEFDTHEACRR